MWKQKWGRLLVMAALLLSLVGATAVSAAAQTYEDLSSSGLARNNVRSAPAVVFSAETYADTEAMLSAHDKPEIVLCAVDGNGNVKLSDRQDYPLAQLFAAIEGTSVPAVRIESAEEAAALSAFLSEHYSYDLLAVSSSAELLVSVRTAYPMIRGVFDASARDLSAEGAGRAVAGEACAALAQIVLLADNATRQNVYEIQSRAVLTWIACGDGDTDIYGALTKGTYGIVNRAYASTVRIYGEFGRGSLVRPSYIVGHRGYPAEYNSNSVEGIAGAYRAGATHTEIDVHLTADGEIVVMHDATLDATTNGTGNVEQMTLAEIRQYQIIDNMYKAGHASEIPILSDVFDELMKDEFSDKLLVLEIKQNSADLVRAIADELQNYPGVRDRMVIITFEYAMLSECARVLPDIPRGYLDSVSLSDFRQRLSPVNAFLDNIYTSGLITVDNANVLKLRGYPVWAWTYADQGTLVSAVQAGFAGLTTDDVSDAAEEIMYISAPATMDPSQLADGKAQVTAHTYGGAEKEVTAEFIKVADVEGGEIGVFRYTFEDSPVYTTTSPRFYSELVQVVRAGEGGKGCGSALATGAGASVSCLLIALAAGCAALRRRRSQ